MARVSDLLTKVVLAFQRLCICRIFTKPHPKEGKKMSQRDDVVAAGVAAIQAGEVAVLSTELGKAFDQGEAIGTGPGFTQADLDAAKAAGKAEQLALDQPLIDAANAATAAAQAQDAADVKAGQDAVAAVNTQLADLQGKLNDALAAKTADEAVIQGLQGSAQKLADLLNQLNAIVLPPPPQPAP